MHTAIYMDYGNVKIRLSNESDACKYIHASCADAVV